MLGESFARVFECLPDEATGGSFLQQTYDALIVKGTRLGECLGNTAKELLLSLVFHSSWLQESQRRDIW